MEQRDDYEGECARYVLGDLSEPELTRFEEAYFTDDQLFVRFLAVKDDIVDAYARGELVGSECERFEQHFLSSGPRRRRVEEAKEVIRLVSAVSLNEAVVNAASNASTRSSDDPWWRSISKYDALRPLVFRGALAALLLLVLAGSWVLVRHFQRQQADHEAVLRQKEAEVGRASVSPGNENKTELANNDTTNLSANNPPANSNIVPQPGTVKKRSPQPSSEQVASIFLVPFSSRGDSDSNSLLLRPNTNVVRLHLAFKGDDYSRFDVVLRTSEGEQVLHRRALRASSNRAGKSVMIMFDPSILRRQDYIVTLNGITSEGKLETIADYYFRAERRAA